MIATPLIAARGTAQANYKTIAVGQWVEDKHDRSKNGLTAISLWTIECSGYVFLPVVNGVVFVEGTKSSVTLFFVSFERDFSFHRQPVEVWVVRKHEWNDSDLTNWERYPPGFDKWVYWRQEVLL